MTIDLFCIAYGFALGVLIYNLGIYIAKYVKARRVLREIRQELWDMALEKMNEERSEQRKGGEGE